ncbi:hypothetical protein [Achromobacter sp. AGC39]
MTMTATADAQENSELALEALLQDLGGDAEILLTEDDATSPVVPEMPAIEPLVMASAEPTPEVETTPEAAAPEAADVEEPAAKKAPKAPAAPRKHYANKVERITDKLGADLGDYIVLEMADAVLEGAELQAKQNETLEAIKAAGVKVQNRITFVLEFMAGRSAKLNDVLTLAFKLLKEEGSITVGDEGNLISGLVAAGKKISSARAMGNNTIAALRTLKVMSKDADGRYVPNAESLVLAKMNSMLT